MRISAALLVLLCTTAAVTGETSSGNGASSQPKTITLSMDVSADVEEGKSPSSSSSSSESSKDQMDHVKSGSQQYVTYMDQNGGGHSQEFGLRTQPPQQQYQQPQQQYQQPQQQYQQQHQTQVGSDYSQGAPIQYEYKEPSSSSAESNVQNVQTGSYVTREFMPSVYKLNTEQNSEMNSPSDTSYFNNNNNKPAEENSGENSSPFTPVSLSMQDAFKKYFPAPSQHQQVQPYDQLQPGGASQYGGYENQQSPSANADPNRPVLSIDSLREIVEKQPLAKSNPFDPPSPPLSSLLPPPPNSQLVSESGPAIGQMGQQQLSQLSSAPVSSQYGQSPSQYGQSQPDTRYQLVSYGQPQMAAPPQGPTVTTKYIYQKDSRESLENASSDNSDTAAADGEEGPSGGEEDEGYAYQTDNLDENGKKVYVYQRPVRLPDMNRNKMMDGPYQDGQYGGQPGDRDQVYRKPMNGYEGDKSSADVSISMEQGGGGSYEEDPGRPYKTVDAAPSYHHQTGGFQSSVEVVKPPAMDYQNGPPQGQGYANDFNRPAPEHWHQMDSEQYDQSGRPDGPAPNSGPHQIEYGGFVPIKKYPSPYDMGGEDNGPYMQQSGGYAESDREYEPSPESSPMPPPGYMHKLHDIRVQPLYGQEAVKQLKELGINEDEFYGTVNKILQKSQRPPHQPPHHPHHHYGKMNQFNKRPPMMPKANLYRPPPKNRPSRPYGAGKSRPFSNAIGEDFDFNILKDELPPGASYNPRDVGLDESVLAQIHLLDSGIGGYRFSAPGGHHLPSGRPTVPYKKAKEYAAPPPPPPPSSSGPHPMNSMVLPFIFQSPVGGGPLGFPGRHRVPYSATGKGFRSQYGYRAAASELKPQFILPKKPFKFLGTGAVSPLLAPVIGMPDAPGAAPAGAGDPIAANAFGNIFGIRSIKGIKSLVSYLTGGITG